MLVNGSKFRQPGVPKSARIDATILNGVTQREVDVTLALEANIVVTQNASIR